MATRFRLKRRAFGGATGAPSSLLTSELAYNESDDILYIGFGDDGNGNSTSIRTVAGVGAFLALVGNQTIAGIKTYTSSPLVPTPTAGDDSTKAASTAFVAAALAGAGGNWGSIGGSITNQTDLVNYVAAQIAALVDASPAALNTLNELAAAMGDDPNFAATITSALGGKSDTTLSNLSNLPTARANLGLGTIATQNANAVNITGGTIDGVTIDGGTF